MSAPFSLRKQKGKASALLLNGGDLLCKLRWPKVKSVILTRCNSVYRSFWGTENLFWITSATHSSVRKCICTAHRCNHLPRDFHHRQLCTLAQLLYHRSELIRVVSTRKGKRKPKRRASNRLSCQKVLQSGNSKNNSSRTSFFFPIFIFKKSWLERHTSHITSRSFPRGRH